MGYLAEGSGYVHIHDVTGAVAALKAAKKFAADNDSHDKKLDFDHWVWEDGILTFTNGKCESAMEALKVIAPFVEPGCYVQMSSEVEDVWDVWRWVFDGKTVREILPLWPEVRLYRRRK